MHHVQLFTNATQPDSCEWRRVAPVNAADVSLAPYGLFRGRRQNVPVASYLLHNLCKYLLPKGALRQVLFEAVYLLRVNERVIDT